MKFPLVLLVLLAALIAGCSSKDSASKGQTVKATSPVSESYLMVSVHRASFKMDIDPEMPPKVNNPAISQPAVAKAVYGVSVPAFMVLEPSGRVREETESSTRIPLELFGEPKSKVQITASLSSSGKSSSYEEKFTGSCTLNRKGTAKYVLLVWPLSQKIKRGS